MVETPSRTDTHALQILGRLQLACNQNSPASFQAAHMELTCAGRLSSASAEGVVVSIPNPPDVGLMGALAVVSYSVGHAMVSFESEVAAIAELGDADETIAVTMSLPTALRSENRRSTVRVPVPRGSLEATILDGPAQGQVRAIDLSLLGMLIELEPERAARLEVGNRVGVRLVHGSLEIEVDAHVRRKERSRFGLSFENEGGPPKRMPNLMWRIQEARRDAH